jgi:hypothetical protein
MEAVAEAMRGLGYPVPAGRNAIAGRLNRLRSMSIKMPDRPPAEPKPKAKRVRPSKVSKPKPPRAKGTVTHDNGVDYLSNEGCKAILDVRGGRYNLRKCCGKSREAETPYCSGHLRSYQNPGVRKPNG